MERRLEGRVALVTGASRGLGRAIALRLAADGARVAVNYARSAAGAEDVVGLIREQGGDAVAPEVAAKRAEERRVGKECRAGQLPAH